MWAFLGSWMIAWLLGGGLILAVILYIVFFKKNSLMSLAVDGVQKAAFNKGKSPRRQSLSPLQA